MFRGVRGVNVSRLRGVSCPKLLALLGVEIEKCCGPGRGSGARETAEFKGLTFVGDGILGDSVPFRRLPGDSEVPGSLTMFWCGVGDNDGDRLPPKGMVTLVLDMGFDEFATVYRGESIRGHGDGLRDSGVLWPMAIGETPLRGPGDRLRRSGVLWRMAMEANPLVVSGDKLRTS